MNQPDTRILFGTLNLTCSFVSACGACTHRASGYYASRLRERLQQHPLMIEAAFTPVTRAAVATVAREHAEKVKDEIQQRDLLALADLLAS